LEKNHVLPGQLEKKQPPRAGILVVDDNSFVRESIINLIDGNRNLFVAERLTALRQLLLPLQRCKPDLVVMDLRFKDGEGLEVDKFVGVWTVQAGNTDPFPTRRGFVRRKEPCKPEHEDT